LKPSRPQLPEAMPYACPLTAVVAHPGKGQCGDERRRAYGIDDGLKPVVLERGETVGTRWRSRCDDVRQPASAEATSSAGR
jgi:hypothetical protein